MKRHAPSPRAARGFTLLEAIIALVVFSMGAMALYGWLSTNIITLNRIKERQQVEASAHVGAEIAADGLLAGPARRASLISS